MTPHDSPARSRSGLDAHLIAAGNDADQILRALDTEIALRRAGRRLGGNQKVYAARLLSVTMLLLLIFGTVGALVYLQSQLGGGHRPRPAAVNAALARGPSTPGVDPARQSGPPTR